MTINTARFFASDSFWNTPLGGHPDIDPASGRLIGLLEEEVGRDRGFWINNAYWSVPVYEADRTTPCRRVYQRVLRPGETYRGGPFGHGPGFGFDVPVPPEARPSREADRHLALIDRERQLAWDMWGARWRDDGELESFTGMAYPLNGPGTFDPARFPVRDGESLHRYGPSRHAGVPALAGLVMREELLAGRIEHKLSFASCVNAWKRFVPPAIWDDGRTPDGIPEGAVVQLDPNLDLAAYSLSPAGRTLARALQVYGMVDVDSGGGATVYAEELHEPGPRSWAGILTDGDLLPIPFRHYRILRLDGLVDKGYACE